MNKKMSPYAEFKNWLYEPKDSKLSEDVIKAVSLYSVLCMMSNFNHITVYLNEHFNNFNSSKLDKLEFFEFIKDIVQKNNINKYKFSFFKHMKKNKDLQVLHSYLPFLKQYEVSKLLELAKDDEDFEKLRDYLGLSKIKKKKITKKDKKEMSIRIEERNKTDENSFESWLSNFGKELQYVNNTYFQK